jgi:hypothetical protein
MEAAAKNAHLPRKGSTVYILKFGDSVAVPVKVDDIVRTKMYGGRDKSFIAEIQLSSNKYGLESYTQHHFDTISYDDDRCQVVSLREYGDDYYIGTSKEAIQQYVNNIGNTRLPNLLQAIERKESELAELYKQKDEAEAQANLVVTEAMAEHLNESMEHPGKDVFSGVSFKKFSEYLEKEGYTIDDSQTHEYQRPYAMKDVTFVKAGDQYEYIVSVECEQGTIPQKPLDYVYRIIKVDNKKSGYEKNLIMKPDFKDPFWKPLKFKK